ncbi:hypothetical protein SDC9_93152 [bioreactor metagenome]|uniref:Uncharacterized protein n=1 Tax=bioreactor metagenome TaxID=1076179 RepID=A0A645A096_9ZZZZ
MCVFPGKAFVGINLKFTGSLGAAQVHLPLNGKTVLFVKALPGVDCRIHGAPPCAQIGPLYVAPPRWGGAVDYWAFFSSATS